MTIAVSLDRASYRPGEEASITVQWDGTARHDELRVSLLWYTEGRGTEDVGLIGTQTVERPDLVGTHRCRFLLPEFPWSFSGKLVSVIWAVEAELGGEVARTTFVLAPDGREVVL